MANTSLSCGPLTIKYLVFFFNLIFFICGLSIVIVGAAFYSFYLQNMALFEDSLRNPATGVIVLGVAVMIFSFFGCCGSKSESVWMLRVYAFFLVVLLISEIAGGIAVAVLRSDIGDIIAKQMNATMPLYGSNDTVVTTSFDNLQQSMKCCGTSNYTDWRITEWSKDKSGSVPDSCCIKETLNCGQGIFNGNLPNNTIFTDGCAPSLRTAFISNLGSIVSVTVVVAIIEVIGLWMSCSLINAVKERYEVL